MIERLQPADTFAISGISAATRSGNLLFISGQVPLDRGGQLVGIGDFQAQAEQVFANLDAVLAAGNSGFDQLLKLTVYFTDIRRDLASFREIRNRYIPAGHEPASSAVQISELFDPDVWLEVEAIALTRAE